jgi:hypothetical protein
MTTIVQVVVVPQSVVSLPPPSSLPPAFGAVLAAVSLSPLGAVSLGRPSGVLAPYTEGLKVHKNGSNFEFCNISLLVMLKY